MACGLRKRRGGVRALLLVVALAVSVSACGLASQRAQPKAPRPTARRATADGPAVDRLGFDALNFPTASDGWVAASVNRYGDPGMGSAVVLATKNAGASWGEQWRGALNPTQVVASDATHAWLLGRQQTGCGRRGCRSVLVGTADGGARWTVLTRFALIISGVAFTPSGLGLAAARAVACHDRSSGPPRRCPGQVLISHDGGRHWRVALHVAQPVVAVAAGRHALWAVEARIALPAPYGRTQPVSFVLLRSGDTGRSWTPRGEFHAGSFAGLRLWAQFLTGPAGSLVVSPVDPDSCAMHGCGVDGVWRSQKGGRGWLPLDPVDPSERGVGMACAYYGQVPVSASPDGRIWEAPTFDRQDCRGPLSTLFASTDGPPRLVHRWRDFGPAALSTPTARVGYAMDQSTVRRSTDGGTSWVQVLEAGTWSP